LTALGLKVAGREIGPSHSTKITAPTCFDSQGLLYSKVCDPHALAPQKVIPRPAALHLNHKKLIGNIQPQD
jgi:hypothetical protein